MFINNEKIKTGIIELIDWRCNSEGNFHDTSIRNFEVDISEKKLIEMSKYAKRKTNLIEGDWNVDFLFDYYIKGSKLIKHINCDILKQININEINEFANKYICSQGLYVKKNILANILYNNLPLNVLNVMKFESLKEGIESIGVLKLYALTRILEDAMWHNTTYDLLEKLTVSDFEEREIEIINLKLLTKGILNEIILAKEPLWEDKIGGSIFVFGNGNISPLRFISKFFHYRRELQIHSDILNFYYNESKFEERFIRYFLQSERKNVGFFDPHCLIEAVCWDMSIHILHEFFEKYKIDIGMFNGNCVLENSKKGLIVSFNDIDLISNEYKRREFPGKHRMFSMQYKLRMFESFINKEDFYNIIIKNADKKSVCEGMV